ncbi:mandelate racemase/muconate lactonizing enzyme family protein [Spirosoma aureum]|uniref:Mandelate racemase/muconate lactonizing enzyme family protein n=1 Tax=Spirosoma aureum TaxID=2692134 RepID=A0A6G9AYA1_9BACT|nr:mandelate racemase/muconate lactonizing enzyme family protein [Spirosoma aureum]QIP17265.1 mandelate racemase/muconate lactonizing enzyme family protein [Spirosoma aureum]
MKNILSRLSLSDKSSDRRDFLRNASLGGLSLGLMFDKQPGPYAAEQEMEFITQKVSRFAKPSELKITDMRVAILNGVPFSSPIIRIDTNQGLVGWGEVRDGASANYALMLKSRLLGKNPCNVEQIFKQIKQFGGQSRAAGGVCGVEMALWDLAGKAYNVPAYQLLGGKYRDFIRLYADTPEADTYEGFAENMKKRRDQGYTFLKMDFGIGMLADQPGMLVNANNWSVKRQWNDSEPGKLGNYANTKHPFTRIQVTKKGLDRLVEHVGKVREIVGYDTPLAADHFGHFDVNTAIQIGKAMEPFRLAWLEDLVPWFYTDQWKQISDAIDTPTLTGEDIYLKEGFIKLIDAKAIDMIHPDLASSGGLLETKKIGDYAEEKGIPMAMHFAGSPISMMANVHCAAATENFVALEHHGVDVAGWEDLITGMKPIVEKGFVRVPEKPGLGVELNEEVAKKFLKKGGTWFAPTDVWNTRDSADREWS